MILDRAPTPVKVFKVDWVEDGYGGRSPKPSTEFVTINAFVLPTGFSGAGWAAAMRYASEGWADTARSTIVANWTPEIASLDLGRWTRVEINGQDWTLVQTPKQWSSLRVHYFTAQIELKGDAA
ncbi:hypothetical protein ACIBG8_19590 [Nonomuraea sp. NPDC050556]|uniref:hypothetical protein n=1 Tax=Nonomuraea sp. NPDC050556 TaxID=3364369 RepID=UPI0037A8A77B